MRRRKTVIMTISQYKYLPAADRIILMNKGTPIEGQQALDSFLAEIKSDPATSEFSSKFVHEKEDDTATKPAQSSVQENLEASNDLEKKEEGEIKLSTLQLFINAMGKMVFLAIILGGILMQFSRGVFDIWLKDFTYAETTGSTPGFFIISFNFTIFILAAFSIICCAYRAWIFTYGNLLSAKNIFQRLVPNVLYAKMSFFDKNSVGSIIQRFSGDTTSLDDGFPFNWNIMLNNVIIFIRSIWIFTAEIPISV